MTPEQLDAIRERARHSQRPTLNPHPEVGQRAVEDRDALLEHVDELMKDRRRTQAMAYRDNLRRLHRNAMHLLAHQQARGIEAREEAEIHEAWRASLSQELAERAEGARLDSKDRGDLRRSLRMYQEAWHREILAAGAFIPSKAGGLIDELVAGTKDLGAQITTLRAENERKDAEIERLRALLKEAHTGLTHGGGSCAACGAEPGCDIDCPVCRWTSATETALGEEVRDA